ncbi:ribosomal protection-like ABC-F family protein [Desulfovibrio desulfuricans]|uniref:ribosomal protection-like ABC-F family protein n=1 Tax=Desulfovibrio desulfuricans TaxID=876 RepID=UPI001AA7C8CF|nr:ABC-F type ribosomal protection protein [Desulfovibrio desulfuricans]QTO41273.1 ABC-F type ribosomal protection protein [Desulfovibrio desulfuricans]CAI3228608.1 Bis-ABC ATPase CAC0528 [Desulfovibrio diazotrophicus]VVU43202.1 Bis-ABC ATPase CAC0528 [Desulfovibrio diazotrophicus]
MALINIANLSFAHDGGQSIFDNVSLQLDTNWKLGLIGRNGRGKTTFLKLLLGEYPFSGVISTPVAMDYFPFRIRNTDQNGYAVARSICTDLEEWRLEREASLLELSQEAFERPFNTLSGGEGTKLLLATLFLRGNNFLLIDEPTNHLDVQARQVVGRYLRAKRGFILVSHDRSLLDSCVDHVLSINRANIELQRGNFSSWQVNREHREQRELADNDRLKKDIVRLEQSARRSAEWSRTAEKGKFGDGPVDRGFIGHKAAKMMQRAKSVEARRNKAMEEKSQLLRNLENDAPLSMRPQAFHSRRLVECNGLSIGYDDAMVLCDITFSVMNGERLALCGKNGSGKSSLLKLLSGHPFQPGEVQGYFHLPKALSISYVPQDASFLAGSLKDFSRERGIEECLLRAVLHRFGFERKQFDTDMGDFSAGQKKKVLLAASLCEEAHLYIWDEPLNYIDVISRIQIEKLILDYQPSMVLVEHDQMFLQRIATSILDLGELGNGA